MTISINQQVDYLWKKLGYAVSKTATSDIKDATNESIPSTPFLPGNRIWTQSELIPTIIPASNSAQVTVYNDSLATTVKCVMDITSTVNRTWLTNMTDWIPVEFGSTYQIKVYLAAPNASTPQTSGIQLWEAGSNNNDEWFFDHESGVLNFIGNNLPSHDFTNKVIYVSGARYTGVKGLGQLISGITSNITISGSTISSTDVIILAPSAGNTINANGSQITNVGYPSNANSSIFANTVATTQYVVDSIASLHPNVIWQGDSIVQLSDSLSGAGELTFTLDGQKIAAMTSNVVSLANLSVTNNVISSNVDLVIQPGLDSIVSINSSTAFKLPVGSTSQRPTTPTQGDIRFNSTVNQLEYYTGSDWLNTQAEIANQIISGDGVTDQFTLNQVTSSTNVFVMINGVVQVPSEAYAVSGAVIIFAEPPKVGDRVEVRFIGQTISPSEDLPAKVTFALPNINVGTLVGNIDSFNATLYQSAKYIISILTSDNNVFSCELLVVHNGTTAGITRYGDVSTGGAVTFTFNAVVSSGQCLVTAAASTLSNSLKVQRFYFAS